MAKSKFGQNFLINKDILKKIAAEVKIKDNDFILEIGSGHGELTKELINFSKNKKVKILAVEKDKKLFQQLKNNFKDKNLRVINKNILNIISRLPSFLPKDKNLKIVGNIPYYLTGKLLRKISELNTKPEICVFTLQKEVGERIVSLAPKLNKLSAIIHFWAEPKIILNISKKNFNPQPKVDSVLIQLKTGKENYKILPEKYYQTVNILFQQPRKTILNNLLLKYNKDKDKILDLLKKINISPNDRPQNLSINQIVEIAKFL
ncbi:MAG: 16S rRNA (adenine(1518)-N(6)/adenine(1519)-N(6))-dimethyltransferase RsmA [Minisyncoccia bacterium]